MKDENLGSGEKGGKNLWYFKSQYGEKKLEDTVRKWRVTEEIWEGQTHGVHSFIRSMGGSGNIIIIIYVWGNVWRKMWCKYVFVFYTMGKERFGGV